MPTLWTIQGECTRENYVSEALSRCGGVGGGIPNLSGCDVSGCRCEMPCASDMLDVPMYSARFTGGNGIITLNPKRPALNDMACIAYVHLPACRRAYLPGSSFS
eukprot:SAG25_NODE_1982_length_2061_cov_1.769113_2_plen_104_part_00